MTHALLIVGGTKKERLDKAQTMIKKTLNLKLDFGKGHPDLLVLEPANSLGIEQIRQLQKKLALKPYSANLKVALLVQAEKLTLPGQNALLKTLEEPPQKSLIILTAVKSDLLLPTIVSRCQLVRLIPKTEIKLAKKEIALQLANLEAILKSSPGEKISQAEKITKNRDQASQFCQNQLFLWREIMLAKTASSSSANPLMRRLLKLKLSQIIFGLKAVQRTLNLVEANVNHRLTIEALLLSLPSLN